MSKYGSQKTEVDGIVFDSKKEAEYYLWLKNEKQSGRVLKFELQPKFILIKAFEGETEEGKKVKHRETAYFADFKVWRNDGKVEVVDVKGFKTEVYKLKKKMLLYNYKNRDDLIFVEA